MNKVINKKKRGWGESGKKYYATSTSEMIAQLFSGTIRGITNNLHTFLIDKLKIIVIFVIHIVPMVSGDTYIYYVRKTMHK